MIKVPLYGITQSENRLVKSVCPNMNAEIKSGNKPGALIPGKGDTAIMLSEQEIVKLLTLKENDGKSVVQILLPAQESDTARILFDKFICPMCYRLNPQHATENQGKGCHTCVDREHWVNGVG